MSTNIKTVDLNNTAYPHLVAIFCVLTILGNIFALKVTTIGNLVTPAGMICFPFTFSVCDIITEVYGSKAAKKAIYTGAITLIIYFLSLLLVNHLPSAPGWNKELAWNSIFNTVSTLRIFLATIVAFVIAERTNSHILSILKYLTRTISNDSKAKSSARVLSSTLIGVTLDTIIFNLIAFLFIFDHRVLVSIIFSQLILKYCFETVGSIIATFIIYKVKSRESIDIVDKHAWIDKLVARK